MSKAKTQTLTEEGLETRGDLLESMVEEVGAEKVEEWMNDPDKRGVVNAMAAVFTDGEGSR